MCLKETLSILKGLDVADSYQFDIVLPSTHIKVNPIGITAYFWLEFDAYF